LAGSIYFSRRLAAGLWTTPSGFLHFVRRSPVKYEGKSEKCTYRSFFFELDLNNPWIDDAAEAILRQIRLKSSAPTFSETEFVCQKTCVKTGGFSEVSRGCE
jgi:hypothetical protein